MICPLCESRDSLFYARRTQSPAWHYYRCKVCSLVFRDPASWPDRKHEHERYRSHQNDIADGGYRTFLSRIIDPLQHHMPPPGKLLDFGCGPQPALASLLEEQGYRVSCYDKAFLDDSRVWAGKYDIITSTEVFEHLHHPGEEIKRLLAVLRKGGLLALMTQPVPQDHFESWHYLSDLTHVLFYSEETFLWIARRWNGSLLYQDRDIFILKF